MARICIQGSRNLNKKKIQNRKIVAAPLEAITPPSLFPVSFASRCGYRSMFLASEVSLRRICVTSGSVSIRTLFTLHSVSHSPTSCNLEMWTRRCPSFSAKLRTAPQDQAE